MNKGILQVLTIVFVLGLSSTVIGEDISSLSYTDPSGDVDHSGLEGDMVDNIDIRTLSIDYSSDPVVVKMTVEGIFEIESSSDNHLYSYQIYIDQTGDGEDNVLINVINGGYSTIAAEFSTTYNMNPNVTGNATNEMTIRFSRADIGVDSHDVVDIYAEASVTNLETFKTGKDHINEDFGMVPEDDDDDTSDDDDDWEWDDDDWEWDDEDIPDPKKETPTDTSITIEIENMELSLEKGDEMFELEQRAYGNTGGDVHHCSYTVVTYYEDGTYEADGWTVGPEIDERESFKGMTYENYFKGTGPDGNEDWSEWEMYTYMKAALSMLDDFMDDDDDWGDEENDTEEKEVTDVYLFVRAYSDEDGNMWNQDSADIFDMYKNIIAGEEFSGSLLDSDDGEGLPSPGLILIIGMVSTFVILVSIAGYRKRD